MERRQFHVTSSYVTVLLSLSCASATSCVPNATSADCQLAGVYQHANVSASFHVSAVSVAKPIQVGVLNTSKAYPSNTSPLLESAIYLDVSSTLPSPFDAKEAGLSGCASAYSLPSSELGKTDNGSCQSLFDDACLNHFISDAIDWIRRAIFKGNYSEDDTDIRESLYRRLLNAPDSCNKFEAEGSTSLGLRIMDHSRELLTPPLLWGKFQAHPSLFSSARSATIGLPRPQGLRQPRRKSTPGPFEHLQPKRSDDERHKFYHSRPTGSGNHARPADCLRQRHYSHHGKRQSHGLVHRCAPGLRFAKRG